MRKIIGLIAFTALVVITLSCASDIHFETEFSLAGLYKGKYIWTDLETDQERVQNIEWKFTDINFIMNADPNNLLDECFCKSSGTYELTVGVELDETSPGQPDLGCVGACQKELGPDGSFDLRHPGDSVIMTQSESESNIFKQVLLKRITQ